MSNRLSDVIKSLFLTCVILIMLEVFSSTILPIFGLQSLRLSFNIILVLFLALRFNSLYLPWCILALQLIHSVFSIEGWAVGTITGLFISFLINYLKDLIDLSTAFSTMIIVQIFQVVWYICSSLMIGFQIGNYGIITNNISSFLIQSIIMSILSPYIFMLLGKIWRPREGFGTSGV